VLLSSHQVDAKVDDVSNDVGLTPAFTAAGASESESKSDSKRPDRSNLPPLPDGWEEFSDEEGDVRKQCRTHIVFITAPHFPVPAVLLREQGNWREQLGATWRDQRPWDRR
jgi:hypothetical protein